MNYMIVSLLDDSALKYHSWIHIFPVACILTTDS